MKRFCIFLLSVLAFAGAQSAELPPIYGPVTLIPANTYTNASGSTSNYTVFAGTHAASSVGILTLSQLGGSGTGDVVFKFSKSIDGGLNYETTPSVSITNVSNGTTAVKTITLLSIAGTQRLMLSSIVNGGGDNITNCCVKISFKP